MIWKIVEDKTEDHWLVVHGRECEDCWPVYRAIVKWDGCVHFYRYYNGSDVSEENGDADYLHICDLPLMIEELKALLGTARTHFGEQWPPQ